MAKNKTKSDEYYPSPGDIVQIKVGGKDITNGVVAKKGWTYAEGGSGRGKVLDLIKNWCGTGKTNVRIVTQNGSTTKDIIWQVEPKDVYPVIIKEKEVPPASTKKKDDKKKDKKKDTKPKTDPPKTETTPAPKEEEKLPEAEDPELIKKNRSGKQYAPNISKKSSTWKKGIKTKVGKVLSSSLTNSNTKGAGKKASGTALSSKEKQLNENLSNNYDKITFDLDEMDGIPESMYAGTTEYKTINPNRATSKQKTVMKTAYLRKGTVYSLKTDTKSIDGMSNLIWNKDTSIIQNGYGFPYRDGENEKDGYTYDYQFIPGDTRYQKSPTADIEKRLAAARADFGLPVHGNSDLARAMKIYMYNRYKVPDLNLVHNRTFTHVFFTRPDVNLLWNIDGVVDINAQASDHTDTAFLWRRNPDLFKLLTNNVKCGDSNNFNLLLSNQIQSFQLNNEGISTHKSQRSWNDHEMVYGESYNGKIAGEFSCTFDETSEYSIINLMKLWITYIANVSTGAWSPAYPTEKELREGKGSCHVFDRAMDYGASVYVFKCGPDGEDILYWTKYYGVFPIVTGTEALSWDKGTPIGDLQKVTITFAYCYKRDWSPISLLEFNDNACLSDTESKNQIWTPAYDKTLNMTSRPFVGCPFVEITMMDPQFERGDDVARGGRTHIRLKYKEDPLGGRIGKNDTAVRSDMNLYAYNNDKK